MKKTYKISLLLLMFVFVISCTKGDVFTGSPVGTNVNFVTLTGTITTTETLVTAGQSIPVTITIPQTFPVDVNVQMTSFLPNINKKTTKTVTIPANQSTLVTTMNMPGGDSTPLPYSLAVQMYLTAITTANTDLPLGFSGYQYSLTSNVVTLDFGDTGVATSNPDRCSILFDFQYPNDGHPNFNNLNMILRDDANFSTTAYANLWINTNNKKLVTLLAANPSINFGQNVTGSGIASSTSVSAISGTSLTLSKNATAGLTNTLLTFTTNPYILSTSSSTLNNGIFGRLISASSGGSVIFTGASADRTYTISIYPTKTYDASTDNIPYRFTIRFPDGTSKVLGGTYTNAISTLNQPSLAVPVLQIVKTTVGGVANYAVTQL